MADTTPDAAEALRNDKELMRLASLVGTDAKDPKGKLAAYIANLLPKPPATTPPVMEEGLQLWVCHPDDDDSHITEYHQNSEFSGCKKHPIADGSTLPMDDFNQLIASREQQMLARIRREVPERRLENHHVDVGFNKAVNQFHTALDRLENNKEQS